MTRRRNRRAVNRRASQKKSPKSNGGFSRQRESAITFPVYQPIYKFKRVTQDVSFDISCDGINPSLGSIQLSLQQCPDYTDFTNLFDVYRIDKIHIKWNPEYTELTDASLLSNATNVYFNTAIDLSNLTAPLTVDEVLQYSTIRSTGITKEHGRSWKPTVLMNGMPCYCWNTCSSPSLPHYGLKFAIPPTGIAMEFRSTVTFFISFASSK